MIRNNKTNNSKNKDGIIVANNRTLSSYFVNKDHNKNMFKPGKVAVKNNKSI